MVARVIKNELNRKLRNCMEKLCEATEQVKSENFPVWFFLLCFCLALLIFIESFFLEIRNNVALIVVDVVFFLFVFFLKA